jgi:FkbM family methyltransferase
VGEKRHCVYTVMLGRYERLNEQPVAARSDIPFLCLTDDPDLRSDTWQLRLVTPLFGTDHVRSQRTLKLRPHIYLPDFDASLYIDNTVLLSEPPERVFETFENQPGFALAAHSFRETVLDEFLAVVDAARDDPGRVFEQLNHYMLNCPDVLQHKPYWTGLMLRDHHHHAVQNVHEIWWSHVMRYSRRDQLAINLAFERAAFAPQILPIDNHRSWFHSWPHSRERDPTSIQPYASLVPPAGRLRALELKLIESNVRGKLQLEQNTQLKQAILDAEQAIAAHVERARTLEEALAGRIAQAQRLEQTNAEQAAQLNAAEGALAQENRGLADQRRETEALQAIVAERMAQIRQLEQHIQQLEQVLGDQAAQNLQLEQSLAERVTQEQQLEQSLAERAAQKQQLEQSFAERTAQIRHLEQSLAEQATQNQQLVQLVAEQAAQHLKRERALIERNNALLASTSWRVTAPIRRAAGAVPLLRRAARRLARTIGAEAQSKTPDIASDAAPLTLDDALLPAAGRLEARTRSGALIYVDASDQRGRSLVERSGDLNPPTLQIWRSLLAEQAWTHVVDVGSNYGEMLVNGGLPERAKIIAIEPNPRIRPFLQRTLRDAGIAADVLPFAVCDVAGRVDLLIDRNWSGTTRLVRSADIMDPALEKISVSAITLADLFCDFGPTNAIHALVKIDVEGNELAVLKGLAPVLDQLRSFAALVEVLHASPDDMHALFGHFSIEMLDSASGKLQRVQPPTYERFSEMPGYHQDIVVRRKT